MSQYPELRRVSEAIADLIVSFCKERGEGAFIHLSDLEKDVTERAQKDFSKPIAPGSAGRIFRDLRQKKAIDYVLISRRESKYQITKVS